MPFLRPWNTTRHEHGNYERAGDLSLSSTFFLCASSARVGGPGPSFFSRAFLAPKAYFDPLMTMLPGYS